MRKAKVLICAALSAAALGGSLIAASPRPAPVAEACVVYAQSGGACVLPGRTPSVTASAVAAPSEREPVKLLASTGIRRAVGILPEIEAETEIEAEEAEATPYTEDELEIFACAIYQEAGGDKCSDLCRMYVGDVMLNRVEDPRFPDTLYEVLTQEHQYGLFWKTGIIWPGRASDPNEAAAVERAYDTARALLEGEHSELYGSGYIYQDTKPRGKDVIYLDGEYFGR